MFSICSIRCFLFLTTRLFHFPISCPDWHTGNYSVLPVLTVNIFELFIPYWTPGALLTSDEKLNFSITELLSDMILLCIDKVTPYWFVMVLFFKVQGFKAPSKECILGRDLYTGRIVDVIQELRNISFDSNKKKRKTKIVLPTNLVWLVDMWVLKRQVGRRLEIFGAFFLLNRGASDIYIQTQCCFLFKLCWFYTALRET